MQFLCETREKQKLECFNLGMLTVSNTYKDTSSQGVLKMLGITTSMTRKRKATGKTVSSKEIPGFSKWIASEVYIEDRIVESTLETLSLNMIENIDWMNNAMDDILYIGTADFEDLDNEESGKVGIAERDEKIDENDKGIQNRKENDNGDENIKGNENDNKKDIEKKDRILNEHENENGNQNENKNTNNNGEKDVNGYQHDSSMKNDNGNQKADVQSNISPVQPEGNSFLLLKSPRRYRSPSSPIKESNRRQIEIIKNTTTLLVEQEHDIQATEYADGSNDSFDMIRNDIRKSFAAKQKILELKTSPYKPDTKTSPSKNEKKSPEEEIKELSRLIDHASDGIFSDESDDTTLNLKTLEKIELSQVKKKSSNGYKSPIKFSEMPMLEPLTLGSTRKKSIIKKTSLPRLKSRPSGATPSHGMVFEERRLDDKRKSLRKSISDRKSLTLQLKPLPKDTFMSANTSTDEPTIKLNRNFTKKVKQEREKHEKERYERVLMEKEKREKKRKEEEENERERERKKTIKEEKEKENKNPYKTPTQSTKTNSEKNDLISRLMQPTESSRRKSRHSTIGSPNKSAKTSTKTTPRHAVSKLDSTSAVKLNAPVLVPTAAATMPSLLPALDLGNERRSPLKKQQLPLTKRSLKSSTDFDQYKNRPLDGDVELGGMLYHHRKNNSNVGGSRIPVLKKSHLVSNTIKPIIKTTDTATSTNILPDDIPMLASENEDEGPETSHYVPSGDDGEWFSEKNLQRQLYIQRGVNPESVFGKPAKFECETVFGRKYGPNVNFDWSMYRPPTTEERAAYMKSMRYGL